MDIDEARLLLIHDDDAGRALRRGVERGALVRVRRGVFVETPIWSRLSGQERLLLRVLALAITAPTRPVFSHWSAGVLQRLPVVRRATDLIDLAVGGNRNRTVAGARVHRLPLRAEEVVEVDGLLCTSLARTAIDIAADTAFEEAVVLADAAPARLGRSGKDLLREALERSGRRRGGARADRVVEFADGRSGSPGESISRVRMHRAGFIAPDLQVRIETDGHVDVGDFGWEEVAAIGEFDGELKYREERYRKGRTIAAVVIDEKNRENRMRRSRPRFARWDWTDLVQRRLEGILRQAGIPKRDDRPEGRP